MKGGVQKNTSSAWRQVPRGKCDHVMQIWVRQLNTRMFRMKNFQVAGGERGKEKEGLGSAVDGRMHNATSGWRGRRCSALRGESSPPPLCPTANPGTASELRHSLVWRGRVAEPLVPSPPPVLDMPKCGQSAGKVLSFSPPKAFTGTPVGTREPFTISPAPPWMKVPCQTNPAVLPSGPDEFYPAVHPHQNSFFWPSIRQSIRIPPYHPCNQGKFWLTRGGGGS